MATVYYFYISVIKDLLRHADFKNTQCLNYHVLNYYVLTESYE